MKKGRTRSFQGSCRLNSQTESEINAIACDREVMIQFDQETCGDLNAALRREFVETNGLGGFASSTIGGLNTRRYSYTMPEGSRQSAVNQALLHECDFRFRATVRSSSFVYIRLTLTPTGPLD